MNGTVVGEIPGAPPDGSDSLTVDYAYAPGVTVGHFMLKCLVQLPSGNWTGVYIDEDFDLRTCNRNKWEVSTSFVFDDPGLRLVGQLEEEACDNGCVDGTGSDGTTGSTTGGTGGVTGSSGTTSTTGTVGSTGGSTGEIGDPIPVPPPTDISDGCSDISGYPELDLGDDWWNWLPRTLGWFGRIGVWLVVPQPCVIEVVKQKTGQAFSGGFFAVSSAISESLDYGRGGCAGWLPIDGYYPLLNPVQFYENDCGEGFEPTPVSDPVIFQGHELPLFVAARPSVLDLRSMLPVVHLTHWVLYMAMWAGTIYGLFSFMIRAFAMR